LISKDVNILSPTNSTKKSTKKGKIKGIISREKELNEEV